MRPESAMPFTDARDNRMRSRADTLIALLLFLVVLAIGLFNRTPMHTWGDDFAAYILQARAIGAGQAAVEMARNGSLLGASDGPIGPSAAPWGLPLLLWAVGSSVGWSLLSLKLVGAISLALLAMASFQLSRLYLPRGASVVVAVTMVCSLPILTQSDIIGSDLPFLALSTVALVLIERSMRLPADAAPRNRLALFAAMGVACAAAFTIRSNGIFLFPCAGVALLVRWTRTRSWSAFLADGITLAIVGGVLCAAYFLLLPDGSHTHTRFLDFSLSSMARRAHETALGVREFVPFSWWPSTIPGKAGAAATALVVCALWARGLWTARPYSAVQLSWILLNLGLLLVFKFNGGIRYLFPFLLPLYIFALVGALDLAATRWGASRHDATRRRVALGAGLAWSAVMTVIALPAVGRPNSEQLVGPYSPASQQLIAFVRERTPATARLSFFKPRALRLLTDRDVLRINRAEHVKLVDYVVLFRRPEALQWEPRQLSPDELPAGTLQSVFSNDDAVVYRVVK
jgi:hypothetical protein